MKKIKTVFGIRSRRPRWGRRKAGDMARDSHDWLAAAAAYADYLAANPDDWGIWIQRGHCLKEAGDLSGAERAYRRAADIAPRAADPFFHLGDVMRRMERRSLAIDYYQRAAALGEHHALADLSDLGMPIDRERYEAPTLLPWITLETLARTLLDAQAARDLRRWDEAEALYSTYLRNVPASENARQELEFVRRLKRTGGNL